jgi:hypothetical protein
MLLTKVESAPYKKPSDFDDGHKEARRRCDILNKEPRV